MHVFPHHVRATQRHKRKQEEHHARPTQPRTRHDVFGVAKGRRQRWERKSHDQIVDPRARIGQRNGIRPNADGKRFRRQDEKQRAGPNFKKKDEPHDGRQTHGGQGGFPQIGRQKHNPHDRQTDPHAHQTGEHQRFSTEAFDQKKRRHHRGMYQQ